MWLLLDDASKCKRFNITHVIYCIRNMNNGKMYVGKTTNTLRSRLAGHIYEAEVKHSQYALHCAIRKHGKESFEVSVLETPAPEILSDREVFHIAQLNTLREGYNMTSGGEGLAGFKHSQETKEKISSLKKGRSMPAQQRKRLMKPVVQLTRDSQDIVAKFDSCSAAYRATGVSNIGMCCAGRLPHAGGYVWKFVDENDITRGVWSDIKRQKMIISRKKHNPLCRRVVQVDDNDIVIREFLSVKEAEDVLGITNVARAARTGKTAGGFRWKYTK